MADHRAQESKGRIKEAAGSLTNRGDLKRKGQNDQIKARGKRTAGDAKNKVKSAAATAKDKISGATHRGGRH